MEPSFQISRSELDLFSSPKGRNSIVSSREVSFCPIGSIDNEGPVTFDLMESHDEFTDLTEFWLTLCLKVVNSNGTQIPEEPNLITDTSSVNGDENDESGYGYDTPEISIPNDFFDCQFRRIGLEINSVRVGSDHWLHPQIAVLKNLLTNSKEVTQQHLKHTICWDVSEIFLVEILSILVEF